MIGERLRAAREMRGLTQAELSAISGAEVAHISRYEGDHSDPSLKTFLALAVALDVSPDYLLGVDGLGDGEGWEVRQFQLGECDIICRVRHVPRGDNDKPEMRPGTQAIEPKEKSPLPGKWIPSSPLSPPLVPPSHSPPIIPPQSPQLPLTASAAEEKTSPRARQLVECPEDFWPTGETAKLLDTLSPAEQSDVVREFVYYWRTTETKRKNWNLTFAKSGPVKTMIARFKQQKRNPQQNGKEDWYRREMRILNERERQARGSADIGADKGVSWNSPKDAGPLRQQVAIPHARREWGNDGNGE